MRKISLSIIAISLVAFFGWVAILIPVLNHMKQHDANAQLAFEPIAPLQPQILDNAFGVYVVIFNKDSLLNDTNVANVLSLNRIPRECDLTIIVATPAITDSAIPILANLTTTDTLVVEKSGLTESGVNELSAMLPKGILRKRNSRMSDNSAPSTPSHRGGRPPNAQG